LVAKERDVVYLANSIEHHSIILRHSLHPKCTRIGFQLGPDDDLGAFEKQTAAHGLRTSRKKDPEPAIDDMVAFEDPKGHRDGSVQASGTAKPGILQHRYRSP
jgi:hypothetical protein